MAKEPVTLYQLPVPSSGMMKEFSVRELPQREYELRGVHDEDDRGLTEIRILFSGVEIFCCTHMNALKEEHFVAYDRLVDLGDSPLLSVVREGTSPRRFPLYGRKHLMITFDDGPAYQFICAGYRVEETLLAQE